MPIWSNSFSGWNELVPFPQVEGLFAATVACVITPSFKSWFSPSPSLSLLDDEIVRQIELGIFIDPVIAPWAGTGEPQLRARTIPRLVKDGPHRRSGSCRCRRKIASGSKAVDP